VSCVSVVAIIRLVIRDVKYIDNIVYRDYDNYFYIVTYFFTNFIGNNRYNSAAKIIFVNRDVHRLQGIDTFHIFSSAKISFGSNNYRAFIPPIYRDNLSYRNKKVYNNRDR